MPGFDGTVVTGLGEGGGFVALPWVRAGFAALLGDDPHPGTLNLRVAPADREALRRDAPAEPFPAGQPGFCDAVVHRVVVAGQPALAVFPAVGAYPPDKLELVLARRLPCAAGDRLTVAW